MDSSGTSSQLPADRRPTPQNVGGMDVLKPSPAAPKAALDPCGTILDGHYKILSLLGTGGMSAVYKAHDLRMDRTVAIKMLHPHLVSDRKNLERFLQEARAESSLKHPNVLSVLSVGVATDGRLYIVMDFLQGESLADEVQSKGAIDQERARELFIQICEGLHHAHEHGIVHRDLKPSNVMLCSDQTGTVAKIVDFGIAKLVSTDQIQKLTQTGAILGSPAYMSPEQCSGSFPDPRSDIYSMGCLMYEVLTGRVPFESSNHLEAMCKQMGETAPSFHEAAPGVTISPDLEELVRKALEKRPEARQQTALQLKDELLKADLTKVAPISNRSRADHFESAIKHMSEKKRRAMRLSACMGVVGILVVSTFVLWGPIDRWAETTFVVPALERRVQEEKQRDEFSAEHLKAQIALGDVFWKIGNVQEATAAYAQAERLGLTAAVDHIDDQRMFEIAKILHGADKGEYVDALLQLSNAYRNRGQFIYAEDALNTALSVGDLLNTKQKLRILIPLTDLSLERGNFDGAQKWAGRALALAQQGHESLQTWHFGILYSQLGTAELKHRDYSAAESSFRQALQIFPDDKESQTQKASVFKSLAAALWYQQKESEGDDAMNKAITIYSEAGHVASVELAAALGDMATHYLAIGKVDQAEPVLQRAIALNYDALDPLPTRMRHSLADCYVHDGRYRDAEMLYTGVLRWIDKHPHSGMDRSLTVRAIDDCHRRLSAAK